MAYLEMTLVDVSDRVKIQYLKNSRYHFVLHDDMIIAHCPSLETAYTVARALKQVYELCKD